MQTQTKLFILDKRDESQLAKSIWLASSQIGLNIKHIKNPVSLSVSREDVVTLFVYVETSADLEIADHISENVFFLIAVYAENCDLPYMEALEKGFTSVFRDEHLSSSGFSTYLKNILKKGIAHSDDAYKSPHEKILETALSFSPDAFIIFDSNKNIIYASEHYYRFYPSFSDIALKGMHVERALEIMKKEQNPLITSDNMNEIEEFWWNLTGQIEVSMSNGQSLRLIAKELPQDMGFLVTTTDITSYLGQKTELEKQTKALQDALEKEQEFVATQKQFINMISHEFRTPLTIMDGNAQVLEQNAMHSDPATVMQKASTIRKSISRLIDLMEGLLSSNMLDTGEFTAHKSNFDLKTLIEDLAQEYQNGNPEAQIQCETTNIPDNIHADKKIITIILSNLLSNAFKFSPSEPQITITAEFIGNELFIQISDNGIGIPENERNKIFDRFYRASNTTGISGSGIGLDLVNQLTKIQNGQLRIYSKENKGTDISVTIPIESN